MARSIIALVLLASTTAQGEAPSSVTFEEFRQAVESAHPERTIDQLRLDEAKASLGRYGNLPDPEITLAHEEASTWQLTLSQRFPWPGTGGADEHAALLRTETVSTGARLAALERRFSAEELFLRMVRTAKLIEVQRESLRIVDAIRTLSHERFKQGTGSHLDFLRTHSEFGLLEANLQSSETDLENLKQHAMLLMGVAARDKSVGFALEWPEHGEARAEADATRLFIEQTRDAEAAARDLSRRRSLPSVMTSGMVMREKDGMDSFGAMVGISIPLFTMATRRSIEREAALAASRATEELSWHDRQKELALLQAMNRIEQIEKNAESLQRDIIPSLKEHLETAAVRLSQGQSDVAHIIEARRMLLDLETTAVMNAEALAEARLSVARIRAGFVEATIDAPTPSLGPIGGDMKGRMSGGTGMRGPSMGETSRSTQRGSMRSSKKKEAPLPTEETPAGGMGM